MTVTGRWIGAVRGALGFLTRLPIGYRDGDWDAFRRRRRRFRSPVSWRVRWRRSRYLLRAHSRSADRRAGIPAVGVRRDGDPPSRRHRRSGRRAGRPRRRGATTRGAEGHDDDRRRRATGGRDHRRRAGARWARTGWSLHPCGDRRRDRRGSRNETRDGRDGLFRRGGGDGMGKRFTDAARPGSFLLPAAVALAAATTGIGARSGPAAPAIARSPVPSPGSRSPGTGPTAISGGSTAISSARPTRSVASRASTWG